MFLHWQSVMVMQVVLLVQHAPALWACTPLVIRGATQHSAAAQRMD